MCVFCDFFFFSSWLWFKLLAQLPHLFLLKASSAVLISFPPVLFPPFFPYSFPFLPALHCLLLDFFFLYFLYYFFYFSFFPPFSSCYFVFLLTSSSSLSHPHPLFDFVTISSLLPSFPFTSPLLSILSYFPSFLTPSSFPSTSATAADWD